MKQAIVKYLLEQECQINKEALNYLLTVDDPLGECRTAIKKIKPGKAILTKELFVETPQPTEKKQIPKPQTELSIFPAESKASTVGSVEGISSYFMDRYSQFRKQLQGRLSNILSINHLKKLEKEKATFIAIVDSKRETQSGNIMLELEDPSGKIRAIATPKGALEKAKEIIPDEVIGISGTMGDGIFFIDDIMWPDVPIHNEAKKLSEEIYAAFLSDTHIGSKKFLEDDFRSFISWINGELGDEEQKEIASKVRYLFVAGDIVDGVGVYPNQDKELNPPDIYKQYEIAAKIFSKVPNRIQIIIGPGNHDYTRLAQPQPPLDPEVAAPLLELENVTLVGNPATIKIHEHDNGGLNVLMYHGVSIDTMIATNPTIKDGYKHPEKVMKALLQRRHLSPQYATNLLHADHDSMVINPLPDIFHAGHVHSNGALTYRGITLINSGTWQAQTDFQKLCGHEPTPSQLPLLNLQTREMKIMNFRNKEK